MWRPLHLSALPPRCKDPWTPALKLSRALLASGRKVSFQGPLLTVNRHPIDQLTDRGTLPGDDSIRDRAIRVVSLFCRRREDLNNPHSPI